MKRRFASLPVVFALVFWLAPAANAATPSDIACGAQVSHSITLTHDLSCPGTVLSVDGGGSPITVNLGGHTITNTDLMGGLATLESFSSHVTVENGRVGGSGISSHAHPSVYQHLTFDGGGIRGSDDRATIRYNTFIDGASIHTSQTSSTITHNQFIAGPADRPAMDLFEDFAVVTDNAISGYSIGIEIRDIFASANVQRNRVLGAGIGIRIGGSGFDELPGRVSGNWVSGSTTDGIVLGTGSGLSAGTPDTAPGLLVSNNTATGNGGDGIRVDPVPSRPDAAIFGISVTLKANVANGNTLLGIDSPGNIPDPSLHRNVKVVDGGSNRAQMNGNPGQCRNVVCS